MERLFGERCSRFGTRCLGYLRYVLNDHFVLVVMVFIGFLSLQYRALLLHFPTSPWGIILFLLAYTALLFFAGRIATYVEAPDTLFLLVKEGQVWQQVRMATRRASLVWCTLQALGQVMVLPIYLKLGLGLPFFIGLLALLTVGKCWWFVLQMNHFKMAGHVDWTGLVLAEQARKQSILQFFALFTVVKGVTTSVKRRALLDGLVEHVGKTQQYTWDFLYLHAFLRSGDFFWLAMRLLGVSLAFLTFVETAWLAAGLVVLFDYLLIFQLLGLSRVYDYQYMARLYPVSQELCRASFLRTLRKVFYSIGAMQLLVAGLVILDKRYILVILVGICLLGQGYLPFKASQVFDER